MDVKRSTICLSLYAKSKFHKSPLNWFLEALIISNEVWCTIIYCFARDVRQISVKKEEDGCFSDFSPRKINWCILKPEAMQFIVKGINLDRTIKGKKLENFGEFLPLAFNHLPFWTQSCYLVNFLEGTSKKSN